MHVSKKCARVLGSVFAMGLALQVAMASPGHSKVGAVQAGADTKKNASFAKHLVETHQSFAQNAGQWNHKALFRAQTKGVEAWVTSQGIRFDFHRSIKHNGKMMRGGQVVDMSFVGSLGSSSVTGVNAYPEKTKYMTRHGGQTEVGGYYHEAMAHDVYPGINVRNYFDGSNIRYDLIVDPKADANQIKLGFKGADSVSVTGTDLVLETQVGKIAHGKLFAYQLNHGKKEQVLASFVSGGKNEVGISLGTYDHSRQLIIDPVIYGTYFGGNGGWDEVHAVAADTDGGVYLTGMTQSTDFPITTGSYFTQLRGTQNVFLAKLQGDAYNISYSVIFGGSNVDQGQFIQLDPYGNIWVAGTTTSADFPLNRKASSPTNSDIFLIRFEKSQTTILDPITNAATIMVGGLGTEVLTGFQVVPVPNAPPNGPVNLIISGMTNAAVPEVTGAFGGQVGFMVRYIMQGTVIVRIAPASLYIGDNANALCRTAGLATDTLGNAYVVGDVAYNTGGSNLNVDTSVTPGIFTTTAGVYTGGRLLRGRDVYIRKYDPTGGLIFSTLLGGADDDFTGGYVMDPQGFNYQNGSCIATDQNGYIYVTGVATSFDFPRTRGVYGPIFDGTPKVFVTKIAADASAILLSTNIRNVTGAQPAPPPGNIVPAGIAVDGTGRMFVTGNITVFPSFIYATLPNPDEPNHPANANEYGFIQIAGTGADLPPVPTYISPTVPEMPTDEPWLNVLDSTATNLIFGTYLGGRFNDQVFGPYVDSFGDLWVNGWTESKRSYLIIGHGGAPPPFKFYQYQNEPLGDLPAALITNLAYKSTGQQDALQNYTIPWDPNDPDHPGALTLDPIMAGLGGNRDGYLVKFRIGRPILQAVTVTPTTIPGGLGASATVVATLNIPAPAEGATVTFTLNNPAAASFSATSSVTTFTVTIPAGQTASTAVQIFSLPVPLNTTVLVKGSYQSNFLIAPLNVVPWLKGFTVNPVGTVGGNPVTGTVTLNAVAPAGGVTVTISSSSGQVSVAGGTVVVAAGQSTATFPLTTVGVDSQVFTVVTAALLGSAKSATLELDPASIVGFSLNPTKVNGGTVVTGTLTLDGLPGPGFPATTVRIQGNPAGYVITSNPITFGTGTTATFTIATPYETSQVVRVVEVDRAANLPGYPSEVLTANLTVDPVTLATFTVDNPNPSPGAAVNGQVTIGLPADQGGTSITITSDNPGAASVASPVIIPAGTTFVNFPIVIGSQAITVPTVVTLTASWGTTSITRTVTVQPSVLTLALSTTSIRGGNTLTGSVTLSAPAPDGGLPVTFTFSPTGIVTLVGTVTIPAGATSATFTLNAASVAVATNVIVTAHIGALASNPVTLTVQATGLRSISFLPSIVRGLQTSQCLVALDGPAPPGGAVITLTSSNSRVASIPITVTVPAGMSSYTFSVFVHRVSRPLATQVTATYASASVIAFLTAMR